MQKETAYGKYENEEGYVHKEWDIIEGPSCWQLKGSEHPDHVNVFCPFPYAPPYVPHKNSVIRYRRESEIEDTQRGTCIRGILKTCICRQNHYVI